MQSPVCFRHHSPGETPSDCLRKGGKEAGTACAVVWNTQTYFYYCTSARADKRDVLLAQPHNRLLGIPLRGSPYVLTQLFTGKLPVLSSSFILCGQICWVLCLWCWREQPGISCYELSLFPAEEDKLSSEKHPTGRKEVEGGKKSQR